MTEDLVVGKGICLCAVSIFMEPTRTALSLGAGADMLWALLKAVHHVNRRGDLDDFLAIALPFMQMRRGFMQPGDGIEVFGSEKSLISLLSSDRVQIAIRRGLADYPDMEEVSFISEHGTAFIRDRSNEKLTPGWIRRRRRRAAGRGKPWTKDPKVLSHDGAVLKLDYGKTVLGIRSESGLVSKNGILKVNTYGFSTSESAAYLPVIMEFPIEDSE